MRHRFIALAAAATVALGLVAAGPASADPPPHCHPHADPTFVLGTPGNDRLVGDDCDNVVIGFQGDDVLIGRLGEDTLRGGRDNDRLRAIDGEADQVNGGSGFDRCRGDQFDSFRRCEVVVVVTVPV
jgi:RTX calcium-binding nonapeptide repeat (4 copies)